MKLSHFKFNLPRELIAYDRAEDKKGSKLLVLNRKTGEIQHKFFDDVINYFDDGDVMIVNNTKVFPAKLYGRKEKTGAKIEVFLLRELNPETKLWDVLVDPARKIRVGNKIFFGENEDLVAEVIDNTTSRGRTIRFLFDDNNEDFRNILKQLGHAPVPTIEKKKPNPLDKEYYQTPFAKQEGAVAAPTAGMHFSRELIKRLKIKGINFADITLHAGLGNFRTIEVEDLGKHKIESEEIHIIQETCDIVNKAKKNKNRICAVGTTTMRTIESSVTISGEIRPYSGWTNLFIHPPYNFRVANAMISNFHFPQSSLMIVVASFAGYENLMNAYKVAVEEKYKFFTFGDAMLII